MGKILELLGFSVNTIEWIWSDIHLELEKRHFGGKGKVFFWKRSTPVTWTWFINSKPFHLVNLIIVIIYCRIKEGQLRLRELLYIRLLLLCVKALFTLKVSLLQWLWHHVPGIPPALSHKENLLLANRLDPLTQTLPLFPLILLCPLSCGLNVYDGNPLLPLAINISCASQPGNSSTDRDADWPTLEGGS